LLLTAPSELLRANSSSQIAQPFLRSSSDRVLTLLGSNSRQRESDIFPMSPRRSSTTYSQKQMSINGEVLRVLKAGRQAQFSADEDWVFAAPPKLVSEIWGKYCARATPIRAFAAMSFSSARCTSGRPSCTSPNSDLLPFVKQVSRACNKRI